MANSETNKIQSRNLLSVCKSKHRKLTPMQKLTQKLQAASLKHDDTTRLYTCAADNDTEEMKRLLSTGSNPNTFNGAGRNCLHIATRKGHLEMVALLLKAGSNPNIKDKFNNTPLHLAITYKHDLNVIKELLHAGADPMCLDSTGRTPLQLAHSKFRDYRRDIPHMRPEFIKLITNLSKIIYMLQSFQTKAKEQIEILENGLKEITIK